MIANDYSINIGDGHRYTVRTDSNGKIVATACQGRWPMTVTATGDPWLDRKLQETLNMILASTKG